MTMRADLYLFTKGHARSRQNAKVLIENGCVIIDGKMISKPSVDISDECEHDTQIINRPKFVSRGGEKLDFALYSFNIDVKNMNCIDIGASTGGFTDCLIKRGASHVVAIDSGHSQLDPSLEGNEKIISIEKYNARFLRAEDFPHLFDIAVMDVSFISQTLIHAGISSVLTDAGILISLIKPQFECGKNALNSHGIVKKSSYHEQAVFRVVDSAVMNGFSCLDIVRSPIEGGSGNTEFLAFFKKEDVPENHVSENKLKQITQAK